MKLSFVGNLALLAALSTARVLHSFEAVQDNHTHIQNRNVNEFNDFQIDSKKGATNLEAASKWDNAVQLGKTIYAAMKLKESVARWLFKNYPDFADTVQSPFDGDLIQELMDWGYNDGEALSKTIERDCDFDKYHKIKRAFDELGLDTTPAADGGPNHCMRIDHYDGPKVQRDENGRLPPYYDQVYDHCGSEYRITGGTFEFGVNPQGAITLLNVIGAAWAAEHVNWQRRPATHELPQIRSTSDIAWGLWNRVAGGDIGNIRYLLVSQIVNPATRQLITAAYGTLTPPKSEDEPWPGIEFSMETAGGQAILGSALGRWAGYFLVQHKRQLGNRFISKVRVFKNDDSASLPYLVFYADPNPVPDNPGAPVPQPPPALPTPDPDPDAMLARRQAIKGRGFRVPGVVSRSGDGKNIVREHFVVWTM